MSERPTPRTDAARRKAFPSDQTPDYDGYLFMAEHASQLERELAEAREENLEQARLLGMSGEREAKLIAQRDKLAARIESIRSICTTNHESKVAFIDRVNAILDAP